ncbi:acyl-CoA dehydrogenase family protein [Actinomadura sp. KC345]|uniref:acyl-CoA dehydrogenase family protein n=1 Tax=Actinomadura sp. KC345 TaxID=2530371 RepID=UPI001FB5885C|nr:acyl-CoA dehydrogenase family protein [Actinomadura sp. KC345]
MGLTGDPVTAEESREYGLEFGRINIVARAVGVAQAAYDAAVGYSRQREAFGRPISDFQAIQLNLAEATEIQAARLLTYQAAGQVRGHRRPGRHGGGAGAPRLVTRPGDAHSRPGCRRRRLEPQRAAGGSRVAGRPSAGEYA